MGSDLGPQTRCLREMRPLGRADSAAALGIADLAATEGRELWTTEDFCAH